MNNMWLIEGVTLLASLATVVAGDGKQHWNEACNMENVWLTDSVSNHRHWYQLHVDGG